MAAGALRLVHIMRFLVLCCINGLIPPLSHRVFDKLRQIFVEIVPQNPLQNLDFLVPSRRLTELELINLSLLERYITCPPLPDAENVLVRLAALPPETCFSRLGRRGSASFFPELSGRLWVLGLY